MQRNNSTSFIVDDSTKQKRAEQKKKQEKAYYEKNRAKKLEKTKAYGDVFVFENGTEVPKNNHVFDNGDSRSSKKHYILDEAGNQIHVLKRRTYNTKKHREKSKKYLNAFVNDNGQVIPENTIVLSNKNGKKMQYYFMGEDGKYIQVYKRNYYNKHLSPFRNQIKQTQATYQNINNNPSIEPINNQVINNNSTIESINNQNISSNTSIELMNSKEFSIEPNDTNNNDAFTVEPKDTNDNDAFAIEPKDTNDNDAFTIEPINNELFLMPFNEQETTVELNKNENEEFVGLNDMNFLLGKENNEFYQNDLLYKQLFYGKDKKATFLLEDEYEVIQSPSKKHKAR